MPPASFEGLARAADMAFYVVTQVAIDIDSRRKGPPMCQLINPSPHALKRQNLRQSVDKGKEESTGRASTLDAMYRRIDENLEEL